MVDRIWAERLEGWIAWNHEEVEASFRAVDPDLIHVRPSAKAPSVAFHAWHIGRWVDTNATALIVWLDPAVAKTDVWVGRGFAERWGMADLDLGGYGGTGAGLDDDASAALPLPDSAGILAYLLATFRTYEGALARIADDSVLEREVIDPYDDPSTIGEVILNHLSHADRHLGMIEALRGVLGERGTATE